MLQEKQAPPAKAVLPRCAHIHRCPICDRFRKTIKANLRHMWMQLYILKEPGPPRLLDTQVFFDAFTAALINIENALSAHHLRRMQDMGDEEAGAYMDAHCMSRDWDPVAPLVDAEGRRLRPRLELVLGDLSARSATP